MADYDLEVPTGAPFTKSLLWRTPVLGTDDKPVRDANGQIVYTPVVTSGFTFEFVVSQPRTDVPVMTVEVATDGNGTQTISLSESQVAQLKSSMTYALNVLAVGVVTRKLLEGAVVPT